MKSWKARLLVLLAAAAMLIAVSGPAMAQDLDGDGFDDGDAEFFLCVDEDGDGDFEDCDEVADFDEGFDPLGNDDDADDFDPLGDDDDDGIFDDEDDDDDNDGILDDEE